MAAQKAPSVVYYVFRGFLLLCVRLVCCRYPEQVFYSFSCSVVRPLLFFMVFFSAGAFYLDVGLCLWGYRDNPLMILKTIASATTMQKAARAHTGIMSAELPPRTANGSVERI